MSVLQAQLIELKLENERLKKLVESSSSAAAITRCGWLNKYRSSAASAYFSSAWTQRFVTLTRPHQLSFYKNEKDTAFFPRSTVDVQGCFVEYEGVKRSRYHTFCIYDKAGTTVARLSSTSKSSALAWINSLVKCGCTMRYSKPTSTLDSPSLSSTPSAASARPRLDRCSDSSDVSELSGPPSEFRARQPRVWRDAPSTLRPAAKAEGDQDGAASDTSTASGATGLKRNASSTELRTSGIRSAALPGPPDSPSSPAPRPGVRPGMLPSAPMHTTTRFSFLSSERITYQKHAGLINLGMVIILTANSRLILENVMKYGVRANPLRWIQRGLASSSSSNRPVLICFVALPLIAMLSLGIEQLAVLRLREEQRLLRRAEQADSARAKATAQSAATRTEMLVWTLHLLVSVTAPIAVPLLVLHVTEGDPLPIIVLVMCSITLWMKLISFAQCNWDLRVARRTGQLRAGERGTVFTTDSSEGANGSSSPGSFSPTMVYPDNLTLSNLFLFLAMPTLTYQMEYPRTETIRIHWLCRRVAELLAYSGLMLFLVDQYVEPSIQNSLHPFHEMNVVRVVERVLKLSLPFMYVWLCVFYGFFHLWLNIVAELTRFGDREFYKDWWNATTIGEYWRLWNMPVHKWMLRSVFHPLTRAGCSKFFAGFACFFLSAVMHELAVGLPLNTLRGWAFVGMLFQLPMVYITDALKARLKNEQVGNIIFWLSFCVVGQPMCALLYYHDFVLAHTPQLLHARQDQAICALGAKPYDEALCKAL